MRLLLAMLLDLLKYSTTAARLSDEFTQTDAP